MDTFIESNASGEKKEDRLDSSRLLIHGFTLTD